MPTEGKPTVSVITVVHNARAYLERTILSVLGQSYGNIEYIIIDGDSTDGTQDIIRKYENRLGRWISEPDGGLYDAMNKGMDAATGEYLWFMNAGDEIHSDRTAGEVFGRPGPAADIYYGETEMVGPAGEILGLRSRVTPHRLPEKLTWRDMARGMTVCHQSFIVRKGIAPPFDLSHPFCADIDWIIKCLKTEGAVVNTGLVLSRYMSGGLSKQYHMRSLLDRYRVLQDHFGVLPNLTNHFFITLRALVRLSAGT